MVVVLQLVMMEQHQERRGQELVLIMVVLVVGDVVWMLLLEVKTIKIKNRGRDKIRTQSIMELKFEDHKGTKEEFDALSLLEKRTYLIQTQQEDVMWWVGTWAKINVIGFFIAVGIGVLIVLFKMFT